MRKSTLKMEGSVKSNIEFPKYPHSAVITEQTGCGKSVFVLDLLEKEYQGVFENIVILCPTVEWNKAYKTRSWIGDVRSPKDKSIIIVNPVMRDGTERLQELLRYFFDKFAGRPTLHIIDDCYATKELTKKKDMLSQLEFSILKDLREQAKWVCMFNTKDRDSFEYCLRENDVVPLEEKQKIKKNYPKLRTVN